ERDPVSGRNRYIGGRKLYDAMAAAANQQLGKLKLSNDAPVAFKQMMREFQVDQQKALANARRVAEEGIANLTPEQRTMISTIIEGNAKIADLPPDAMTKIAADISAALKQQAQDLIDL